MHNPKYCLFYDNHTMKACPDVGAGFDVEEFTDRIVACGVDYLTFHARCNQGLAYYATEIGIKHPSLDYDLFGKLAEACQRKDIALTAYLNGGISNEEGLLHREWTTLYFDGREYRENRITPYVRTMCYNSPYRDHLISMVKEVAEKYPVAGFFIDCLAPYKCICPICVKEMKERGIDWNNEQEVEKFSEFSMLRLSEDIAQVAKAINPEFLLYFNGPGYEKQNNCATYMECECLPTNPGWGYEFLPVLSHYMRTLGDKPVLNMTGRFYDWGDFGGLRSQAGIEYDLLYGLANGMRPNIGDHVHPRGDINHAVFDMVESIYRKLQQYEPWFDGAKNITEIAVVYPKSIDLIRFDEELRGATRMLSELKMQFDIVTEFSDWSKYQVLILPDSVLLSDESAKRIKSHIEAGKAVISSGWSGLDIDKAKFVLEKEWGVKFVRDNDFDPAYFKPEREYRQALPDMPLALYAMGTEVEALPGTAIGAKLIKPYYNRHWDGEHAYYYNPPNKITDLPLLTVCGKVAHFSHAIFTGYYKNAPEHLRDFFAGVLEKFLPEPILRTENMPSFARAFVTEQPKCKIVHLLSYVPELRGKTEIVEEPVSLTDITIALRKDEQKVSKVYLAPQKQELSFSSEDNYIQVTIPKVDGYTMIVFE
jgi:Hypothetical glycosyl hydrolase 6/Beta-galactosidase trimerisation domain